MVEETVLRSTEFRTSGNATIYGWKYCHYFFVIEETDKTLQAKWTLCPAHKKPLSTACNMTSNLKKHLETVQKTTSLKEKDHDGDESRKRRRDLKDVSEPSQQKRQRVLSNKSMASPATVRHLVSEYVVEDVLPLSTVESPAFRKLIGGIFSAQLQDRKTLIQRSDKAYDGMKKKVKEALENVDAVSTTADVWTVCTQPVILV